VLPAIQPVVTVARSDFGHVALELSPSYVSPENQAMRRTGLQRLAALACLIMGAAAIAGCDTTDITLLDGIQTVLLGISAAGAILLFRNI
jgi:hypothetical protein